MNEASKMRGVARGHLLKEEKRALSSANARERQIIEGKRLVFSRKQELEYLEKRIFQAGKIPNIRTENVDELGEDEVESPPEPFDALGHAFDVLKQTTGELRRNQKIWIFDFENFFKILTFFKQMSMYLVILNNFFK